MRASRLLSLQMLLETQGRMSAQALADALEISVRTLYRDVDQLSAAGVPIYAERGRNGGFALLPGWKTTLTGLTPSEAQAVFLSGLPGPAQDLGLGGDVEGARLKLLSSLPASWREDAQRVSTRLHLDPMDWYRESDPTPHLPTVAAAVWNGHQITMRYASWADTV
ncbi:MAG: HTH domain-containing protein, partial [Comamonadaceae bacterium]